MKKIGLTGSMGAGKSSVIDIIKECGITVLDCDAINAQLLQPQEDGYVKLIAAFGDTLLNAQKQIDKQRMSQWIFHDPVKKQQAEAILHPLIKERLKTELQKHEKEALVVVEVPLLYETRWEDEFDEVWVVACDQDVVLRRLQEDRHVKKEDALSRLAHQLSQEEKIKRSDVVIYNNSNKENLQRQIYAILKAYRR